MEIFIDRKENKLKISQQGYLEKVIAKFETKDAKPAKVPIATHFQISTNYILELKKKGVT